jgi:uncharacterized protein (DUF1697 family)
MPETFGPTLVLLRGINVGGRTLLSMADLREALEDAGLHGVVTVLQTGNLIVPAGPVENLAGLVEGTISQGFGLEVRAITRPRDSLDDLPARNPYLEPGVDRRMVHTIFLDQTADPELVAGLDPDRSPPDGFHVSGREIFLHYPGGSGRSKLSLGYFERKLAAVGTARNWNTIAKLLDLIH